MPANVNTTSRPANTGFTVSLTNFTHFSRSIAIRGVGVGQPLYFWQQLKLIHFKHCSHWAPCPTRHICLTNVKLPDQSYIPGYGDLCRSDGPCCKFQWVLPITKRVLWYRRWCPLPALVLYNVIPNRLVTNLKDFEALTLAALENMLPVDCCM